VSTSPPPPPHLTSPHLLTHSTPRIFAFARSITSPPTQRDRYHLPFTIYHTIYHYRYHCHYHYHHTSIHQYINPITSRRPPSLLLLRSRIPSRRSTTAKPPLCDRATSTRQQRHIRFLPKQDLDLTAPSARLSSDTRISAQRVLESGPTFIGQQPLTTTSRYLSSGILELKISLNATLKPDAVSNNTFSPSNYGELMLTNLAIVAQPLLSTTTPTKTWRSVPLG